MKWQWIVVCLVVGVVLLGCETKKATPPVGKQVIAPTAKGELVKVDSAIAKLEQALGTSNLEGVRSAVKDLNGSLSGLASHISKMDMEAEQAAHQAGAETPVALMSKLVPAIEAAGQAMEAVIPPGNDIARVQELLGRIKSGVDAVRGVVK